MDESPRQETPGTEPRRTRTDDRLVNRTGGKGVAIGLVAVVIAFFIGFFWQFYQATTVRRTLETTEHELIVERMRVQLANAALAAQAGRYEEARRQMSDLFARMQTQAWALPPELRRVAEEFQAMRDDVITGLSRGNPDYAAVVMGMLDRFEAAAPAQGPAPPIGPPARAPPEEQ
jgi:streptomycin 6-kinase